MKNRSFEVLCHKQIWNARSMGQWFRQHIRIGYAIVRVWWSRVPCPDRICYRPGVWCLQASRAHLRNPDGVAPDSSFLSTRTEILTSGILLRRHSTRISHIRNSVRVTFHLLRIFHIRQTYLDGKGGRFNFLGQKYPDPPIAPTRRVSQPFCTVPRCSPEASRYVRPTFWDILL